jgi:hypothetical protein
MKIEHETGKTSAIQLSDFTGWRHLTLPNNAETKLYGKRYCVVRSQFALPRYPPAAGSTGPSPRFVVTLVELWAGFLFPCYPNRLHCELQVLLLCVFAAISEVDQGFMTSATESIDIV